MDDTARLWRAVSALFCLNGALFGVWASRIPAFVADLQLSPDTLGLLLLCLAGGAIVSFPLAGWLTDRLGAHRLSRLLALVYAIALLLLGTASGIPSLAAALFFFGMNHGAMDVSMNAWAAEVERHVKRPVMSSFHAMFSLGAGAGALSGALAVLAGAGVFVHFALAAVILAALALRLSDVAWQGAPHSHAGPIFALPRGRLALVGAVAFCSSVGEGAMADWSAVLLDTVIHATRAEAALGYAAFSIAMVAVRLSGGVAVARLGVARAARISGAFALAGTLIVVATGSLVPALAGFALMGVGYALIIPLAFSRAASDPLVPPGRAIAGVATLGYGGMLLGPPLIGFIAERTSLGTAFLLLAVLAGLIVALGGVLRSDTSASRGVHEMPGA